MASPQESAVAAAVDALGKAMLSADTATPHRYACTPFSGEWTPMKA